MSTNSNSNSGGVGICTVLFIVFAVLQLAGVVEWSWWWITAPIWLPILLWLALAFLVGFIRTIANPKPISSYKPPAGKWDYRA